MTMTTDDMVRRQTAMRHPLAEKVAAFERIREDFAASFAYLQDTHGQRRFSSFPIASTVRYFHALWICECKDLLLSVPQQGSRYDGRRALEVLARWQDGETSGVVELLEDKLGHTSLTAITQAFQQALRFGDQALAQRLAHGRLTLLNRTSNLQHALGALFTPSPLGLVRQARVACAQYGHTPDQIEVQLAERQTPLYSVLRHPVLAQRNMEVMRALGVLVTDNDADRPGRRTIAVQAPTLPQRPYAEQVIVGEMTLVSR
jgi:hypothetical protein